MRWFDEAEWERRIAVGMKSGHCPGCGRKVEKFGSVVIPTNEKIGIACRECIDGETIERLDPRQDAAFLREVLEGKSGEPPSLINRARRRAAGRGRRAA